MGAHDQGYTSVSGLSMDRQVHDDGPPIAAPCYSNREIPNREIPAD
jgi:hypothetical protein